MNKVFFYIFLTLFFTTETYCGTWQTNVFTQNSSINMENVKRYRERMDQKRQTTTRQFMQIKYWNKIRYLETKRFDAGWQHLESEWNKDDILWKRNIENVYPLLRIFKNW